MENSNLIRNLIRGSEAINQLRKEIGLLMSGLASLVQQEDVSAWRKRLGAKDNETAHHVTEPNVNGVSWEILEDRSPWHELKNKRLVQIVCREMHSSTSRIIYFTGSVDGQLQHHNVVKVHAALNELVVAFTVAFPAIEERWKPFLDAASYVETLT